MRLKRTPPRRIANVSEKSKSLKSPSTTTLASGLRAKILSTNELTTWASDMRPGLYCNRVEEPLPTTRVRRRRVRAGTVDEAQAAVSAEEETDPDVAPGLAAVPAVLRVDLAKVVRRSAGHDCGANLDGYDED